jgi:hypothetical protein
VESRTPPSRRIARAASGTCTSCYTLHLLTWAACPCGTPAHAELANAHVLCVCVFVCAVGVCVCTSGFVEGQLLKLASSEEVSELHFVCAIVRRHLPTDHLPRQAPDKNDERSGKQERAPQAVRAASGGEESDED